MDALEQVQRFIAEHELLKPGERVIAGVSGGADSLCLLDILHRLGYAVIVVHVDHQLRPESAAEAEFTRRTAAAYGLPVHVEKADVRALERTGRPLEEAARLARYEILAKSAHSHAAEVLATGHTADDQAETVLMHFLRGAGPDGLRGMLPSTDLRGWVELPSAAGLRLVRPLLVLRRSDTEAHCHTLGLEPRQDASNRDPAYLRNRLRHELMPLLEAFNPRVRDALLRTGEIMAAHSDLLAEQVAAAWPHVVRGLGPGELRVRLDGFLGLPLAVQRGVLREAAAAIEPTRRQIGWDAIERARRFVADPPGTRQADWVAGLQLRHLGSEVAVTRGSTDLAFPEFPQLAARDRQLIPVPGRLALAAGWSLEAAPGPADPAIWAGEAGDPQSRLAVFDADGLAGPLALRAPAPGDRMQPFGLQGSTTVADLLVDRHIPQPARARWPIVVAGEDPIWVVGLRRAERGRLTPNSRHAILLRLIAP